MCEDEAVVSEQSAKILRGIGPSAASVSSAQVDRPTDKFWVYLTKISPDVTEQDVENLAKECLHVEEVTVKSLIPRGRPRSALSFISFKVEVSPETRSKAMDPLSWPQGIEFREFIEEEGRRTQNFWKPIPNADSGTTMSA